MSKQVYFVIAVDVDNKTVAIDDEMFSLHYETLGGYYDTKTKEWGVDEDNSIYDKALKILNAKAQLERE